MKKEKQKKKKQFYTWKEWGDKENEDKDRRRGSWSLNRFVMYANWAKLHNVAEDWNHTSDEPKNKIIFMNSIHVLSSGWSKNRNLCFIT